MSFRLGPMHDGANRIEKNFQEFSTRWADVKESWRDSRRDCFEREHLSSLGGSLSRLAAGMQKFSDAVGQANRELADDWRSPDDA